MGICDCNIAGCAGGEQATTGGKVKVFGAFATPIEEPWDGVIHDALLKAKEDGLIEYTYTEDISATQATWNACCAKLRNSKNLN